MLKTIFKRNEKKKKKQYSACTLLKKKQHCSAIDTKAITELQYDPYPTITFIAGMGTDFEKKNSNLCGDTADFTPPPPCFGQDFMQSPVIDMCPSKVLHWLPKTVITTTIHENQGFF